MDPELVRQAQAGDQEAFERLAMAAYVRLHTLAHGILRDPDLAEDAIQAAMVSIWRDLPKLRDVARFDAWSYRILVHACHAEGRRVRRWLTTFQRAVATREAPSGGAHAILDRDELERAFQRLPIDQRTVVALRYYLDLKLEDIAAVIDAPIGTVNSRLHRAMKTLRATVEADALLPGASESKEVRR